MLLTMLIGESREKSHGSGKICPMSFHFAFSGCWSSFGFAHQGRNTGGELREESKSFWNKKRFEGQRVVWLFTFSQTLRNSKFQQMLCK